MPSITVDIVTQFFDYLMNVPGYCKVHTRHGVIDGVMTTVKSGGYRFICSFTPQTSTSVTGVVYGVLQPLQLQLEVDMSDRPYQVSPNITYVLLTTVTISTSVG